MLLDSRHSRAARETQGAGMAGVAEITERADAGGRVVAIVGATGAVGEVLLRVLEERRFPVAELRALASEKSVGSSVRFRGRDVRVELARPEAEVPLVVPEINPGALEKQRGIVACPNCTTIGFVMALEPLRRAAGLRSVVVTTLQAVSGAGRPGIDDLEAELGAIGRGEPVPAPKTFSEQIAHNVLPLCDSFRDDGYSTEEMKLLFETRKILELPDLAVSMTCVRVPVPVGHSAALLVETARPLSVAEARRALEGFPGVRGGDEPARLRFPTPQDVPGRDEVLGGRPRKDLGSERLWLWEVSDNLRKGAATNAVQIAEEMIRRGLA